MSTASAINSEAVFKYKSSLTVAKIEKSSRVGILSKYQILYPALRMYNPSRHPSEFNGVISTISTLPRTCKSNSFEYNLFLNRNIWELGAIQQSVSRGMKASGYKVIKINEFGVTMWETARKEYAVTFITKLTPFTFVNSVCKV